MPTPRLSAQIAKQAGQSLPPGAQDPKSWQPGLVLQAPSGIGGVFQVSINGGTIVQATSAVDAAIADGDLVWVVRSGGQTLIVGKQ